jgi:hypothetical protein
MRDLFSTQDEPKDLAGSGSRSAEPQTPYSGTGVRACHLADTILIN